MLVRNSIRQKKVEKKQITSYWYTGAWHGKQDSEFGMWNKAIEREKGEHQGEKGET